jgi:hypothetical protein
VIHRGSARRWLCAAGAREPVVLPLAGSLYIAARLARRVAALGRRWSVGRPGRLATGIGLAVMAALAAFWITQGQFGGW